MTIEELETKVKDFLENYGILGIEKESIFNHGEPIYDVRGDGIMMIGPHREAWIWTFTAMTEDQLNHAFDEYKRVVGSKITELLNDNNIDFNPNISVQRFITQFAKTQGGEAPTADLATKSIKDLISEIKPINPIENNK